MLLSGTQLDYSIWNLDSIQANYAVISQGGTLPRLPSSTSSAASPTAAPIEVDWVAVPNMTLSPADAAALSYRHYRDAMSQGVINFEQSSSLYQEWRAGFPIDPSSPTAPVYAVGIRDITAPPSIGSVGGILTTDAAFDLGPSAANLNVLPSTIPSLDLSGSQSSLVLVEANLSANSTGNLSSFHLNGSGYTVSSGRGVVGDDLYLHGNLDGSLTNLYPTVDTSTLVVAPTGSTSIGVTPAWDLGYSGKGVVVSVVDSDVQFQHPDLYDSSSDTSLFNGTSGSSIVVSAGNDEIGTPEFVTVADADANGHVAFVASEGGEISIESLVDEIENTPDLVASENQRFAATRAAAEAPVEADATALADAGISGELARAIVFEVLDGESAPVVYAATGHAVAPSTSVAVITDAVYRPATFHDGRSRAHRAANGWTAMASDNFRTGVAEVPGTVRSDGSPVDAAALAAGATSAAGRSEVFSQWGNGDQDRLERDDGSYAWLAASPLLAVLAAERLLAARDKRNQRDQADAGPREFTSPPRGAC